MADNDLEIKFGASIEEINAAINEVKDMLKSMAAPAKEATAALKGIGEAGEHIRKGTGAITQLRETLQGLTSPIRGIRSNLGEMAEAFAAAFAVHEIAEFANRMDELGEKTERTAKMFGVSVEQVGQWDYLAKATGTSSEELARAMERLQRNLSEATKGTGPAASALHNFGLSAQQLIHLPLAEQLNVIADAVSKYADGGTKLANVQELLGRSGAQMIPILDKGRKGLEDVADAADRAGVILSDQIASAFELTKEHTVELSAALQGLETRFYSTFRPAIDIAVHAITRFMESLTADNIHAFVSEAVSLFATFAEDVVKAVGIAVGAVEKLMAVAENAKAALGQMLLNVLDPNWGSADGGMGAKFAEIDKNVKSHTDSIVASIKAMADQSKVYLAQTGANFGDLSGAHFTATKKPDAKPVDPKFGQPDKGADKAAKDQLEATQTGLQGELKAVQDNTKQKIAGYADDLKNKQITESQKLQLTLAALAAELKAEEAIVDKELALGGLSLNERAKLLNEKAQLDRTYASEVQKAQQQAADATTKEWTNALTQIQGAFDSQLRPLLSHTETLGQAFKKTIADMVIKFIEGAEKMALQWVVMEATKTAASAAGVSAQKAINSTSVMSDAGRAAAGAYASVAEIPVIGPFAAPAAAAAAFAGTMAVGSFDQGSWSIPADQMALIHQGETIIPPGPSTDFRSIIGNLGNAVNGGGQGGAGQGGGDTHTHVHFNIHNPQDSSSIDAYLKRNARGILKAINHGVKSGSHLGLSHIGGR